MIKTINSKTIYKNNWMTVKEDDVEFASGSKGIFGIVEKPDFSLVVPFFDGGFQLVKQYRYPVKESFWEFPQGSYEDSPETPAVEVAKGELEEETGLKAEKIKEIGYLYEAYGYCNQGFHIFLATELIKGKQNLEASEQGMKTAFFSVKEFEQMIESGEVRDAPTVSAYGLLKMKEIL
jgi:ADP-ribose pyrophosphatase